MRIRKAGPEELDELMQIYAGARDFMAAHGNPHQWGERCWPPRELVAQDIREGILYVCELDDGRTGGVFCFFSGEDVEPVYRRISEPGWAKDGPYGVVHRIASAGIQGGAGAFCLKWAFEQCGNLRIDTHKDNTVMQGLLKRAGFRFAGNVVYGDGVGDRLAYDLVREDI